MNETAKHEYATIGFTYLFGLICASFMSSSICFIIFIVLGIVFFLLLKRTRMVSLTIAAAAAAFMISGAYQTVFITPALELSGSTAFVTGTVTERLNPDNDTVLLSISGETDGVPVEFSLFTADTGIGVGDEVEFTAVFSEFRDSRYFAEASYYYSKGVFLKAYAKGEITVTGSSESLIAYMTALSDFLKGRLDEVFTGDTGGIIKAMLFGDKSDLSAQLSVNIRRSGISHLTAVSGMHLSLMVHIAVAFIQMIFRRRPRVSAVFSILFAVMLMMLFGMTVSVIRSGVMMLIYYCSFFVNRKSNTLSSVSGALFIILAVNPCACRDIGLWLSVLGTIGVGIVSPMVMKRLRIPGKSTLRSAVVSSLCASVCTVPVGMFCFGGISLVSVITGLLVQPFFTIILIIVPIGLILYFISAPFFYVSGIAASLMNRIINLMGSSSYSYIETDNSTLLTLIAVLLPLSAVLLFLRGRRRHMRNFYMSALAAFATAVSLSEMIGYNNITVSIYSDGENAVIKTEDKTGAAVFTLSDSSKTADMIYEYTAGEKLNFICIASDTDNNNEIKAADYDCTVHLPEMGNAVYDISGEYTASVIDGEIILDIRGITIGLMSVKSGSACDIAVYCGYKENFNGRGNFATILCDKRFYNYGEAINVCYEKAELIIDNEGGIALRKDG